MAIPQHRVLGDGLRPVPAEGIESSNSTMAQILGGRQKTWMTGKQNEQSYTANIFFERPQIPYSSLKGPPKRKRGRPPKAELARRSADPVTAAREEFSIPSPRLDHISDVSDSIRVFDQAKQTDCRSGQQRANPQEDLSKSTAPLLDDRLGLQSVVTKETLHSTDSILPSPAPSDELAHRASNIIDLEEEEGQAPDTVQQAENARLAELAARYGGIAELEKRLESVTASESMNQSRSTSSELQNSILKPYGGNMSSRTMDSTVNNETPPAKQPRLEQSNSCQPSLLLAHQNTVSMAYHEVSSRDLTSLLPPIDSRLENARNSLNSQGALEVNRLHLIRDSCAEGDIFYLILHEIFCYCSINPASSLPGFDDRHERGMMVLKELILPNDGLPSGAIKWFSTFPSPILSLRLVAPIYEATYKAVLECIIMLEQSWQRYKESCFSMQIPPLADFIERDIGVRSRIFQRVIYTAIHRGFWVGQYDNCFQQCLQLFLANQKISSSWQVRRASGGDLTKAEMTKYYQGLIANYGRIHQQHLHHLQIDAQSSIQRLQSQTTSTSLPVVTNSPMGPPPPQGHGTHSSTPATMGSRSLTQYPTMLPARGLGPSQRTENPLRMRTDLTQPHQYLVQDTLPRTPHFSPDVPLRGLSTNIRLPSNSETYSSSHSFSESPCAWTGQSASDIGTSPATQHASALKVAQSIPSQLFPKHPQRTLSLPNSTSVPSSTSVYRDFALSTNVHTLSAGASGSCEPAQSEIYSQRYPIGTNPQTYTPLTSRTRYQFTQTPLFPPFGYSLPSVLRPNPTLSALHQAHTRDSTLIGNYHSRQFSEPEKNSKYFQCLKRFAAAPFSLLPQSPTMYKEFQISAKAFSSIPKDDFPKYGAPSDRQFQIGSQLYRLRCADVSHMKNLSEDQWAIAETTWPSAIVVVLNGISLEIRRKIHHGKDLPIDLTSYVKEGLNSLQVSVLRVTKSADVNSFYSLAVEVIEIDDYKIAREAVEDIEADTSKEKIKQQLANISPEVEVINKDIIVNVIDPFSSRLIETPVRGITCRHYDCFDLDNFLQTRQGSPCKPEQFKCPICGADARPQCLRRDGWIVSILKEIRAMGRSDARAIIVNEEAAWSIKEEEKEGENGDGTGRRKSQVKSLDARGDSVPAGLERHEIE
ncbi:hypothetical protein MMC06_006575, partial [Schaereria dolodes]|nr:hypothetical protein [Schaereria dolodes]